MNLDDRDLLQHIDSQGMFAHIAALPDQLEQAWAHGHQLDLPAALGAVQQVVVCGMGGSAISGDLLAALAAESCHAPIQTVRGYDLPTYVLGEETLVITLSHSGNTEETLSMARQAAERGTRLLAITTGGRLAEVVAAGGTVWQYRYDAQPRAAVGWLYGLLLAAASRLHLIDLVSDQVSDAIEQMRAMNGRLAPASPLHDNVAKRTAGQLMGRVPVIWGSGLLAPVANRWKTQFNENAKTAAYFETMPELNHNSVVGLEFPDQLQNGIVVFSLASAEYDHPRVQHRQQATHELLLRSGVMAEMIHARGSSRLAQQMNLVQLGDYLSAYLAIAYGVDPTPIDNIVWLKEKLAGAGPA